MIAQVRPSQVGSMHDGRLELSEVIKYISHFAHVKHRAFAVHLAAGMLAAP